MKRMVANTDISEKASREVVEALWRELTDNFDYDLYTTIASKVDKDTFEAAMASEPKCKTFDETQSKYNVAQYNLVYAAFEMLKHLHRE